MQVRDVMTSSPLFCKPSDTVERVAKLMAQHDCGVVPVCDLRKPVGIITDRDITTRAVAAGKTASALKVSEVMTKRVFTVRENDDVDTAVDRMKTEQVRRLPVVNAAGDLIGIVAPSDLAPVFASTNVADFLLAVSYWTRKHPVAAS